MLGDVPAQGGDLEDVQCRLPGRELHPKNLIWPELPAAPDGAEKWSCGFYEYSL